MEKVVISTEDTEILAGRIAKNLKPGTVLALYGNLGSGKTTFTSFLVKALGIDAKVQSPSFVLARIYEQTNNIDKTPSPTQKKDNQKALSLNSRKIEKVNHLDLYRLQNASELADLGLEEYFTQQNSITIIEWPELAEALLPINTIRLSFEDLGENTRKISIEGLRELDYRN
jgi:tRNA threonylcarbamoyladenosine biosynthesis protein TsaE